METSEGHQPSQVKINSILNLLFLLTVCIATPNPHQPFDLIWVIENPETGYHAQIASTKKPLGKPRFPNLTFDLCRLADNSWPDTEWTLRNSYPKCRWETFYICPWRKRTFTCGGLEQFYCASWGYKTSVTGIGTWRVSREDLITVAQQGDDSRGLLRFTDTGKQAKGGFRGGLWASGICVHCRFGTVLPEGANQCQCLI